MDKNHIHWQVVKHVGCSEMSTSSFGQQQRLVKPGLSLSEFWNIFRNSRSFCYIVV